MTSKVQILRPVSQLINITENFQNKLEVTKAPKANVTVSQTESNKIEVTVGSASAVAVSNINASVVTQTQGAASVVTLTAAGPQGPSFAGATFFNNTAIGNLNNGNAGAVLEWDGSLFQPTQLLENDLTLNGGNF
jgi:hypothetical protein